MPFQIIRIDITKLHVDAIVNAVNLTPEDGAGGDGAVYEAAGKDNLSAKLHEVGAIGRGSAAITAGYDLPARYIIHTVGTAWRGGTEGEEDIIRRCYRSIFKKAVENDILSLAIPLFASGSYGFPKGIALSIALTEIEAFLSGNEMNIYLVVPTENSFSLSSKFYGDIDKYIRDNYQEEIKSEVSSRQEVNRFFGRKASAKDSSGKRLFASKSSAQASAMFDSDESNLYVASLMEDRSLDDVIKNLDKTFMELVFSFADAKGMSDVEVQRKANLDRKAFSKLKCGTTKNPSKSTALALAIALELDLDDTKDLLSRAGLALSPCSKQDVIVRYFIEREAYDIYEINVALFEHGEQLLGSQTA